MSNMRPQAISSVSYLDQERLKRTPSISLDWKEPLRHQVYELKSESAQVRGVPLSIQEIQAAETFISELPILLMTPEIALDNDLGILFEWRKRNVHGKTTMFSVIARPSSLVYALLVDDEISNVRGGMAVSNDGIKYLATQIDKYFAVKTKRFNKIASA